jgi:hypothetical protein
MRRKASGAYFNSTIRFHLSLNFRSKTHITAIAIDGILIKISPVDNPNANTDKKNIYRNRYGILSKNCKIKMFQ